MLFGLLFKSDYPTDPVNIYYFLNHIVLKVLVVYNLKISDTIDKQLTLRNKPVWKKGKYTATNFGTTSVRTSFFSKK